MKVKLKKIENGNGFLMKVKLKKNRKWIFFEIENYIEKSYPSVEICGNAGTKAADAIAGKNSMDLLIFRFCNGFKF